MLPCLFLPPEKPLHEFLIGQDSIEAAPWLPYRFMPYDKFVQHLVFE
jgi:hypothetical protein